MACWRSAASCREPQESARGGKEPVRLAGGETRVFLEDGDEVLLRARATAEGRATIGFGECRAVVLGANV
jgi:fumarylacetoacetase